ncbi:MAG TPA: flagellar hook-associated protein FlgL [Balneolaceae bacterium]|nr:flagellar hook-associated protein FlgL [Balneolaceae bacterium]
MRVTQLAAFKKLKQNLAKNREALAKYQQEVSTGKRVTKASDGSVAFATSRHIKNAMRKNQQYQSNINSGLSKAQTAESALNSMIDTLSNFKSTAISGATDTLTKQNRQNLADKVNGMKKRIVSLANTKFNGEYLFGGTNTSQKPFSLNSTATGGVSDTSNGKNLKTQISDISNVSVSVTGKALRNTSAGDLFSIMQNVETALRNNNPSAISNNLDAINKAYNHVTNLTSNIGNHINRLQFKKKQLKSQNINQKGDVSQLVDANIANVMMNVQKYEISYKAALSVHSRIIKTSLVNYL